MIKNKLILFIALLTTTALTISCTKSYLDINDNPNSVTDANVTPELIFPAGATGVATRGGSRNFDVINNWVGYTSAPGDFAIQQDETSYNFDRTGYEALWQNHYNVLFDLEQTKTKALAKSDQVLAGAAMILSVKLWQELVDLYGDIPYTEAFHPETTLRPKFDKAELVYKLLNERLDQAISYMGGTQKLTFPSTVSSVLFGGVAGSASNQNNWIKFANTLKLRLLIHASTTPGTGTVPGITPATEYAKIVAQGGILTAGQTVSVNPGFLNAAGKQSYFWASYGFAPSGSDANTSIRANKYIVNRLAGDPRLNRIFANPSAGGGVTGTTYGQAAPANPDGKHSSKFGAGLLGSPSQNAWILTSVESLFLKAEGVANGLIPGTPSTAYDAAITESFAFYGATGAAAYISANPYSGIANGSPSSLIYQKYLALVGLDAVETYTDLRRFSSGATYPIPSGFISVNPGKLANKLPNRFLYPQEEYTLNGSNVPTGIDNTTIFTSSKIFWQP
jgi:Starch-binding associating with outer membrane